MSEDNTLEVLDQYVADSMSALMEAQRRMMELWKEGYIPAFQYLSVSAHFQHLYSCLHDTRIKVMQDKAHSVPKNPVE